MSDPEAGRGRPSYLWRAGQDSRLALIEAAARVTGARLLDLGCGVGLYTTRLAADGAWAVGSEIEWPRARSARVDLARVVVSRGEALPFADATFDTVLLHEVLEHVADDRLTLHEVARVLVDGGRAAIFVPNRWWPFETHGVVWRGNYRFGNYPLVNYLPDAARNALVPHARVYTAHGLRRLLRGVPLTVARHARVFPGFDRLASSSPRLARVARATTALLAVTPASVLGLSHFLVVERQRRPEPCRPVR